MSFTSSRVLERVSTKLYTIPVSPRTITRERREGRGREEERDIQKIDNNQLKNIPSNIKKAKPPTNLLNDDCDNIGIEQHSDVGEEIENPHPLSSGLVF